MKKKRPLEGLKVVDFSWVFTGPMVTKYLGDHGAEIIKIESAARPDGTRLMTPFAPGAMGLNGSGVFANYNSSKYSMNINLREARGVEVVNRLVERADIVLETFGPGVMGRLGLDYDSLKKVKPDVIMLSMSMVGQYGPHSGQPSFGQVLQAQYIDLAMLEASVHFASPVVMDYTVNGRVQNRMGNRNPGAAPHGVYPCKGEERWCAIAVFSDGEWDALCRVMGNPEWTGSPKFDTLLHRTQNIEKLDELMGRWTRGFTAEEVMAKLQAAGVAGRSWRSSRPPAWPRAWCRRARTWWTMTRSSGTVTTSSRLSTPRWASTSRRGRRTGFQRPPRSRRVPSRPSASIRSTCARIS